MSIIYRALQKTQQNREKNNLVASSETAKPKPNWLLTSLMVITAILATILILTYLPEAKLNVATAKPVVAPIPTLQVVNEDKFKRQYILNGVFISDNAKIAMINNQYFHEGDAIAGLHITRISDNNVKLKNENQTIILETPV